MMENTTATMSSVRIQMPFNFAKNSLAQLDNDEKSFIKKTFKIPTHGQEFEETQVSFEKSGKLLTFSFDKLLFKYIEGINECILTGLDEEETTEENLLPDTSELVSYSLITAVHDRADKLTKPEIEMEKPMLNEKLPNTQSTEFVQLKKQKRGRPRKLNNVNENKIPKLSVDNDLSNKSDTANNEYRTENFEDESFKENESSKQNQNVKSTVPSKRYSLRGKKLDARIMASEKGDDIEDELIGTSLKNDLIDGQNTKTQALPKASSYLCTPENIKDEIDAVLYGESSCLQKLPKEFTCKICDEKHQDPQAIQNHVLKTHSSLENVDAYLTELKQLKYCCQYCGETFAETPLLKKHIHTEHKDFTFTCPKCDFKCKHLSSLKMHIRNVHLEPGLKRAFCHLCSASFRSQGSLKQHIDYNHNGNKHVACETCNKKFYNKSQLKRHQRVHGLDPSKKVSCSICKKTFLHVFNLKRHLHAVHQPQSECFHCSYCGKGFSQKTAMISHVQLVHFNLLPYSCKLCSEHFPRANLLKDHMNAVHLQPDFEVPAFARNSLYDKTDEDKFYCSYCSEGFVHKIRLIEHMHSDHADAFPYKCDKCVQGFLERSFLVIHTLKAHGILLPSNDEDCTPLTNGGILQIITSKAGLPKKITQSDQICDGIINEKEGNAEDIEQAKATDFAENNLETNEQRDLCSVNEGTSTLSSVLVEVAQGSNTYQYLIETSADMGQQDSEALVQDIANMLMAAEQNDREKQNEEISFIISEHNSESKGAVEVQSQEEHMETTQSETDRNMFSQSSNQVEPYEVVIDENQHINTVLSTQNQVETLHIEQGDIIEYSDTDLDGRKNYYRIVNVLENSDEVAPM